MDDGKKYVDIEIDQSYFLETLQDKLGRANGDASETISIISRFVTEDPASGAVVYDEVTVDVIGSGESFTAYCDYSQLEVEDWTQMSDITYDIPSPSPVPGQRVDYDLPTTLTGQDRVSEQCMDLVTMTFDIKLPDGSLINVWREDDEYDEESNSGYWIIYSVDETSNEDKKSLRIAIT